MEESFTIQMISIIVFQAQWQRDVFPFTLESAAANVIHDVSGAPSFISTVKTLLEGTTVFQI